MAGGGQVVDAQPVAHRQCRHPPFGVFRIGLVVGPLGVDPAESLMGDDRARGGERGIAPVGGGTAHAHVNGLAHGVGHLGGHRALPDQLVHPGLHLGHLAPHLLGRAEAVTGGTDGLVGLLGVLHLLGIQPGLVRQKRCPESFGHRIAGRSHGGVRQGGAVGPHVGDVALLVQRLGGPHGHGRRQAQLAPGLLLERGGHEGSGGAAAIRLDLHGPHADLGIGQAASEVPGGLLVEVDGVGVAELPLAGEVLAGGHLGPVHCGEVGGKDGGIAGVEPEHRPQPPVVGRGEGHALALALDHYAGGHALHPPSRQAGQHLLPQNGRHLIAVEPVEQATGLLGVHQAAVQITGRLDGGADGRRGDLVEHHALDVNTGLGREHLQQVPGDGLALAVLIGGEIQLVGLLEKLLQLANLGLLARRHHV